MTDLLTLDSLQAALPKNLRMRAQQDMVDTINNVAMDPEMARIYRENLLTYTQVLTEGRYKMSSYIDAVRYVSFKLMSSTNISAYRLTFPDRFLAHVAKGATDKDMAAYAAVYNGTKLVMQIYEQTLIPTHILNADMYQDALNTQARLMKSANSELVQTTAANSILNALKRPETQKVELAIGIKEDSLMSELREVTQNLVNSHRQALTSGAVTAEEVAHSDIIQGECEVVDEKP